MKTIFLLIICAFSFVSAPSNADPKIDTGQPFVGYFYCATCALGGGVGGAMGVDASMFIRIVVNMWVDSWMSGFNGRTVAICNASSCQTYQYLKNGHFVISKVEKPPKEHDYKNRSPDRDSGGGDGGGGGGGGQGGSGGGGGWVPLPPPGCYGDCDGTVTVGPIGTPGDGD